MATVVSPIIEPDSSAIKAHLEAMFEPCAEHYPQGLIELRYGSPSPNSSANFTATPEGIAEATSFAANRNREGANVYFGVNPRKPTTKGAASDTDVSIAFWHFADLDDVEAVDQAGGRMKALPPTLTVTTGMEPHRRPHLYWRLEEPVGNMPAWTERQRGIAQWFDGDSVINPSRIMRLAGTVNYPPQHKLQRGYKMELTSLRTEFADEREPVSPDQIAAAYPGRATSTYSPMVAAGQTTLSMMAEKNGVRPADYIARIMAGDHWHENYRDLVGHWISVGWSDFEILLSASALTLPGYALADTERSVQQFISSARVKWNIPEPQSAVAPAADAPSDFSPTPWVAMDPRTIPPREWLFGDILARKFVSVLVAPPGVGKSILTIEAAVSVALKRDLGPFKAHEQSNVWLFNNEDPREELDRRISAFLVANGIPGADLNGKLFVDCGEEQHLMVATYAENGTVMRMPVVDAMIEHIKRLGIGLLIVDPFIETHGVNENNNNDINVVARLYREIAQKTGCAVWLVHHTRKTPAGAVASAPGDSEAGRGASALGGVARFTATLFNMSKEDAKALSVDEDQRHLYVRFDDGKANLKLKTGAGIWWRKESVSLENARGFRPADSMGVLVWAQLAEGATASTEEQKNQWAILGNALCLQMEAGKDITLNAAGVLCETAAKQAGLTSQRSVERLLLAALSTPKIIGAWRLSYINEKRGNGSNWIRKEEYASWSQ